MRIGPQVVTALTPSHEAKTPDRNAREIDGAEDREHGATYRHLHTGRVRVHPRRASVLLVGEETAGIALRDGTPLVIGRAAPSDLIVADRSLSRVHARISWDGDRLLVEDLGSTNGTFVGGELVQTATIEIGARGLATAVLFGSVQLIAHSSAFSGDSHDGDEVFMARLDAELQRARTFRRPLAVLAVRTLRPHSGWHQALAGCIRPVDALQAASAEVALVALAETGRAELNPWVARFRAAQPGQALRIGAALFPDHGESSSELIRSALQEAAQAAPGEIRCAASVRSAPRPEPSIVLESPPMKALYDLVARVARTRMPVLVVGETGAGKELVARAVHDASPRAGGPFRAINCATIPTTLTESALFGHEKGAFTGASARTKGLFEDAEGGTVFLDEVAELPLQAQAALLRVLETGRVTRVGGTQDFAVDVRVVAATHRDLSTMASQGLFRDDLLYRLDAMTLEVPPLRERVEDIRALAQRFLKLAGEQWGTTAFDFEPAVLDALCAYRWPGNVRQLRNVVDRAAAIGVGPRITLADLPPEIAGGAVPPSPTESGAGRPLTERVAAFEREIIRDALAKTHGNQSAAAEFLGIPRRTLAHKVKRHGLA